MDKSRKVLLHLYHGYWTKCVLLEVVATFLEKVHNRNSHFSFRIMLDHLKD